MASVTTYPVPGRGAWTRTGGLLPTKPGAKGSAGYYRAAQLGEVIIGSTPSREGRDQHDQYVVKLGVKAIQQLVGMSGNDVDGWFGPDTRAAVEKAQARWNVEADGIVGRVTMRAGIAQGVREIAAHNGVPEAVLGGILVNESALDPAAVGVNGIDHGLAQINLLAHAATVSLEMAMEPVFAMMFTAGDAAHIHEVWVDSTTADPWDIAIANHNSPLLAKRWAQTGKPPVVTGRAFQIADYVQRVRQAW